MELTRATMEQYERLKKLGFPINTTSKHPTPTLAFALKWFRDEKKIFIDIQTQLRPSGNYSFSWKMGGDGFSDGYKTFEEAEGAGLDFALNYLLNEK